MSKVAIDFDTYMQEALFKPGSGFYQKEDILDHFHTPLSYNSGFRNLLVHYVSALKQPFLEVGPNHGLLATALVEKGFSSNIFLCEKSHKARESLCEKFASDHQVSIDKDLPKDFSGVVVLQEILDCFPANWYTYRKSHLYKKQIAGGNIVDSKVNSPEDIDYFCYLEQEGFLKEGLQFVYSEQATEFFKTLLTYKKSTLILIDYGFLTQDLLAANNLVKAPLRAYRQHNQVENFWKLDPGSFDITYDIDFSWFLELAVNNRAQVSFFGSMTDFVIHHVSEDYPDDLSLLKPFLDPRQFGQVFKVAVINT